MSTEDSTEDTEAVQESPTRSPDPAKGHLRLVPEPHDAPIREAAQVRACLAPRALTVLRSAGAA
ncbi:MAG TPA: hypothetical protein VG674_31450 [Amycolatopsis sp.]|nr:hypothetical protein [Amycolatopsis sp.]